MHAQNPSEIVLLKVSDVMLRVGLSRPSIYARMAAGQFPRPVYPAPRAPRWRSDEVREWIERLSEERAARAQQRAAGRDHGGQFHAR